VRTLLAYLISGYGSEAKSLQVLREFIQECLVATAHEKVDILNLLTNGLRGNVLNCDFRSIAVMNTIMPSLEDGFKIFLEVFDRRLFCRGLVRS
jgi:hypothetical protein